MLYVQKKLIFGKLMKINLGVHLGFAITRYPEPKEWAKLIKKELDIQYVQFVSDLLEPSFDKNIIKKQINIIKEQINKYDLEIKHTFTSPRYNFWSHPNNEISEYWSKWFKKFIDISVELNSIGTGSLLGIYSVNDYKNNRQKIEKRTIDQWRSFSIYAKNKGLDYLLWEPMSIKREMGETISKSKKLTNKLNKSNKQGVPILLCLDVDHGDLNSKNADDYNPYKWIEKLGNQSPVIHIKQRTKDVSGHKPFIAKHNSKGIIFPKKIISYLKKLNLKEIYLYLELSFREREPHESQVIPHLVESVEYWKKYIK